MMKLIVTGLIGVGVGLIVEWSIVRISDDRHPVNNPIQWSEKLPDGRTIGGDVITVSSEFGCYAVKTGDCGYGSKAGKTYLVREVGTVRWAGPHDILTLSCPERVDQK